MNFKIIKGALIMNDMSLSPFSLVLPINSIYLVNLNLQYRFSIDLKKKKTILVLLYKDNA